MTYLFVILNRAYCTVSTAALSVFYVLVWCYLFTCKLIHYLESFVKF